MWTYFRRDPNTDQLFKKIADSAYLHERSFDEITGTSTLQSNVDHFECQEPLKCHATM